MSLLYFILETTAVAFFNSSLLLGLIFGGLILLRPVTNRLLLPRDRLKIWFVGWYSGYLIQLFDVLGYIQVLPSSFRTLIAPQPSGGSYGRGFLYTPPYITDSPQYTLALPGGPELLLHLSDGLMEALILLWSGVVIALSIWDSRQTRRLRDIGRQGRKMDKEEKARYGLTKENVVVRLCQNLPTSFVRFGNDDYFGDGTRFVICVQDELTEEQLRLVLLHEGEHLRQHHVWWKSIVNLAVYFYWWNPVIWLACRLTCRDMELACDEGVMERLDEGGRRAYARTLVELAAGKPMWGALTAFGECDAALRIRRVANWRPRGKLRRLMSLLPALLLILFFYCGG